MVNIMHPNQFVALLKDCSRLKDIKRGAKLHAEITKHGLETNIFIGNTLIDFYGKCGSVVKAQNMFYNLLVRDVISWTALILGYTLHGHSEEALYCYQQMIVEGVSPNAVTFICCLKACGSIGAAEKGQDFHVEIVRQGLLQNNVVLGNALIDMYAKCGLLAKAQEVFDLLPSHNIISWNALMTGYARHGRGEDALECFEQMQVHGMCPNAVTYVSSLKACGSVEAKERGQEIHTEIAKKGVLESDLTVNNALLDMYVCCGLLVNAQEVFDKLLIRDVISWTALIAGYMKYGRGEEALVCFDLMQLEGVSPNAITFACSLNACGSIGAGDKGQEIHAQISRGGLLETDLTVGSALVDMYAKCGLLARAHVVFDKLPTRDGITWNALLAGYANNGYGEEALFCFEQMQRLEVSLDAITFVNSLKASGSIGSTNKCKEIHAEAARTGYLLEDIVVGNALVDAYAKCSLLSKAQEVLEELPIRNIGSWNALLAGYTEHGRFEEALYCFQQMQSKGISPDALTFVCMLKVCRSMGSIEKVHEIHSDMERKQFLETNPAIGNALVDLYVNCGLLDEAQKVFDALLLRDVISWTAIISGYAGQEHSDKAMHFFKQMQVNGVFPDAVTFSCILKACGSLGATNQGQEVHAEIERQGLRDRDLVIGIAVVDMYANCGLFVQAQEVFNTLADRDVVSWNALIAGYAQLGDCKNTFCSLRGMTEEDIMPNAVTFVSILTACSHAGLVDEGLICFEAMRCDFGLVPARKHYICILDLISRAGQLDVTLMMIDKMQFHPNLVTWNTLMGACRKWGEMELGKEAFEQAMHLDESDAATYVGMANIYADGDM